MAKAKLPRRIHVNHDAPIPEGPRLPPNASVGQRWRFRRNLAIYVLNQNGFSQRLLADIFDLPRSSIGTILKQFAAYEPDARMVDRENA